MDILLILNAQNSFLSPTGSVYMGEKAEILKIRLIDYLSGYQGKRVFFRTSRAMQDTFFVGDSTHSIATTEDYHIVADLKEFATCFFDITRYNAFFKTTLESFLAVEKVKSVGIVGLETHTSVLLTAEELRNRDYEVTVIEPCVMSRDDHLHGCAISLMRNSLGVRINA